jgi:hypothetical protein
LLHLRIGAQSFDADRQRKLQPRARLIERENGRRRIEPPVGAAGKIRTGVSLEGEGII